VERFDAPQCQAPAAWLLHNLKLYLTGFLKDTNLQIPGKFSQNPASFSHPEAALTTFALTFAGCACGSGSGLSP
jgi:hypothetical protein